MTQTRTPAEVDTELAALYEDQAQAEHRRAAWLSSLHREVGDRETGQGRRRAWGMTDAEAVEAANRRIADGTDRDSYISRFLSSLEGNASLLDTVGKNIAFYEEYYRQAGGWSRFFRALSSDGHVHSSQACATCHHGNERTKFGWHPELSGKTEAEAVEEFGEKMCTLCFPSAPANPAFHAPGRRDREAMEAKAAEKAARKALKDAKAITNPDGTPLVIVDHGYRETIGTLVTARNTLLRTMSDIGFDAVVSPHMDHAESRVAIEALVTAIAAKTGEAPEAIRTAAQAKADKKTAKDLKR